MSENYWKKKFNLIYRNMENDRCANEWQSTSSNANPNTNVRSKVRAWMSTLVHEMRTKSPVVVQKWVDSIPSDLSSPKTTTSAPDPPSEREHPTKRGILKIIVNDKSADFCETIEQKPNECSGSSVRQVQLEKTDSDIVQVSESTAAATNECSTGASITFWQKGPAILTQAFTHLTEESRSESTADTVVGQTTEPLATSILSKVKINEFYNKLNINRKRYSFIKERRMEARQLVNETRERYLASAKNDATDKSDISDSERGSISPAANSTSALIVCDSAVEMDVSTDDISHLSHSIDNVSAADSFNLSTQSITDGQSSAAQLNVGRKMAIGEIGRSTSDNPRLRNKFHLADIGRSFSEHQDEEAIMIGNYSTPSSSIAIQKNNNNNKTNGGYFERRAYSVSPTQRGNMKRGVLSRDHSLCEMPRHRNSMLRKDGSFHSDSSHCSSVESLLDARKPDPEAILRHLGFGPVQQDDILSRIPKRFLKPSQVPGIDTEAFVRQQQIASNLHEQSILGYRGLVGNPHVPPSLIVAKIMEQFQLSEQKAGKFMDSFNDNNNRPMSAPPTSSQNVFEMPDISET